ncbi:hypothetical protein JTB14_018099 [Gonioctena quinquepunctata]|nr:hypothetical protein JTB14_018099 [Gonioctena quinquepunctata]
MRKKLRKSPTGSSDYFIEKLTEILYHHSRQGQFMIICGDFNIDFKQKGGNSLNLTQVFSSYCLKPHVSDVTRPDLLVKRR